MTNEELESKFEDCFDANTRSSEGGFGPDVTDRLGMWRSFEPIIAAYAKQQIIAFDNWKRINKWSRAMDDGFIKPIGTAGAVGFKFQKASFDDIYSQFIEQQNK